MASTELKELKVYWETKYPSVTVTLQEIEPLSKYFGKMRTKNSSHDLVANTIGELISQGEMVLRAVNNNDKNTP